MLKSSSDGKYPIYLQLRGALPSEEGERDFHGGSSVSFVGGHFALPSQSKTIRYGRSKYISWERRHVM